MANVLGLVGYNPSNGLDKLIAAFGGDLVDVSTGLGFGQQLLSSNNVEAEVFLDRAWFVNGSDPFRYFNGTTWTKTGTEVRAPTAKFIKRFKNKLYLGAVTIQGTLYPSRVWYSDLPSNNSLTWGLEQQNNLQQSAGSNVVTSPGAQFKTYNIKVGDPIFILTGPNAGRYFVSSIISETQLTLTQPLTSSSVASTYWVGGNWFDVNTDDNDILTGFGENADRLLVFKRDSLHRYDQTSLRRIKGAPGTTSGRSIVTIGDFTYYFHRTGLYKTDAVNSSLISRSMQDYIDGISASSYDDVVGWKLNEENYRCFIGNVSNSDTGVSVTNCHLTYNVPSQTFSPGNYPSNVLCATPYVESQARNIYFGTDGSQVYQDNTGNVDGGTTPIALSAETNWVFPFGSHIDTEFTRLQVFVRRGRNIKLRYKLYGEPNNISKEWIPLGDISDNVTEFKFNTDTKKFARGIKFLATEYSGNLAPIIEKIVIFARPRTSRTIT